MIQPDNLLERLAARAKKRREFAEHAETKPAFYGEVAPRLAREEAAILDEAAEQLRLSRRRVGELESALRKLEDAEDFHANCQECEGLGVPELCEVCFPHFDGARLARWHALPPLDRRARSLLTGE